MQALMDYAWGFFWREESPYVSERNMQLASAQEALGAEARARECRRQHASLLVRMRAFFRLGETK